MKMHSQYNKQLQAFTLIELLITIGIIIILIGIATPQVLGYINRTKTTRAQMDMNTLKTSLLAFYHDWGEFPANLTELTMDASNTVNCSGKYTISGLEGPLEYHKTVPFDIFIGQNTPKSYLFLINADKNAFILWSNGPNHTGLTTPVFNALTNQFDLPEKDTDDVIVFP